MDQPSAEGAANRVPRQTSRWTRWTGLAIVLIVAASALWLASPAPARMARERIVRALEENFASKIEWQTLNVTIFPRVRIEMDGLVFHFQGRRDLPPLFKIRKLSGVGTFAGLLRGHVALMRVEGLQIHVPPRSDRPPSEKRPSGGKIGNFVIDEIRADGTTLTTTPTDARKEPLTWDIQRLTLHGYGPASAASFVATLRNALPPGDIGSSGKFGPWASDEPSDTPVSGQYTFQHADLSVFRGIAGTLSAEGTYRGALGRIETDGHTDTPNFTVQISGNPVHLTTQFHAVVDGTDGDTWLQPVTAQLGRSSFTAQGSITGIKGVKGKTISLDVTASNARLQDMLRLAVKGEQPPMSGVVGFHTKMMLPPDDVDVAQKLQLDGGFEATSAHFTQVNIQEKVDKLSHDGKGEPKEPEGDTVASNFSGQFALNHAVMTFKQLSFAVPGVDISFDGRYGIVDGRMDFHGTARLQAELSQTTTGFKSFLLKALDPFFKKKNAGTVLPIHIGGTRDHPIFGLDIGRHSPAEQAGRD